MQYLVTCLVIRSEHAKLTVQLHAEQQRVLDQLRDESRFRRWETKYNRIADLLGEFIAATEIDSSPKQQMWLPLLHKIQLLLRYDNGPEQALNGALNEVGYALQGIKPTDKAGHLALQSKLAETAKALLAQYHHAE